MSVSLWRLWSTLACALFLAAGVRAAEPVRIGIWSAPEQRDRAALVASLLSKNPDVALLERDELRKIGNEAVLDSWLGDKTAGRLQIENVDALLFLATTGAGETAGCRMRLASVKTGIVITNAILPLSLGVEKSAESIVKRVVERLPKLRGPAAEAVALSVLNLRSTLPGTEWKRIEAELTALLENRLANERGIFLLDRRALDEMEKEKMLGADDTPFRGGVWLADGAINPAQAGGRTQLEIAVRLRRLVPPDGIAFTIHGSAEALPAAADEIVRELLRKLHRVPDEQAWDRAHEAAQFAEEAVWAWRRKDAPLALQAIGAARALGDRSPDLLAMRITQLCPQAAPAREIGSEFDAPPNLARDGHAERMEIFNDALADWDEYEKAGGENALHYFNANHDIFVRSGDLRGLVAVTGMRLLRDEIALNGGAPAALRDRLRDMTGFDPGHGKISGNWNVVYDFAGYLARSPDELFTYYREVLVSKDAHLRLCATALLRVLRERASDCIPAHLEPDRERRAAIFEAFQKRLLADPETTLCALFVRTHGKQSEKQQVAAARAFLRGVIERGEPLLADGRFPFWATSASNFDTSVLDQLAPETTRLVAFYLEKSTAPFDSRVLENLWKPENFAPAEAPELWRLFSAFRDRTLAGAAAKKDPNLDNLKNTFRIRGDQFAAKFPEMVRVKTASAPHALKVTRFWEPPLAAGERFAFVRVFPVEDTIYATVRPLPSLPEGAVFAVDPHTLQARQLPLPAFNEAGGEMIATKSAAFAFMRSGRDEGDHHQLDAVRRIDVASSQVETKSSLRFHYQDNAALGDDLYLNLWSLEESGIARMRWPSGETIILASSRRRPARNQFDDCDNYHVCQFFAGPGGRPCALIAGQPYYIREEPGEWPRVFERREDPGKWPRFSEAFWSLANSSGETMLYSRRGDFVLLDPARGEPAPLIVSERTAQIMPEWTPHTAWDAFVSDDLIDCLAAKDRGLFALHRQPPERGSGYSLRWYRKNGPRTPVEIPIEFESPPAPEESREEQRPKDFDINATTPFSKPTMRVCGGGLIFCNTFRGFWFLPFADLEQIVKP